MNNSMKKSWTKEMLTQILRPMVELRGQSYRVARSYEALPRDTYAVISGSVVGAGTNLILNARLTYPIGL